MRRGSIWSGSSALDGVVVVGCADPDLAAAEALAARVPAAPGDAARGGLRRPPRAAPPGSRPTPWRSSRPHLAHYRPAMDALQAGCHVFIEKPLSTNVQEAADIVGLARGRDRKVGVGHQFRLRPSLVEARRRLAEGAIGPLRLVTATLAQPWLGVARRGREHPGGSTPRSPAGASWPTSGDHLSTPCSGPPARSPSRPRRSRAGSSPGLDLVTAAAIRLADGTPATLAVSGVSPGAALRADLSTARRGRLRATDRSLVEEQPATRPRGASPLPEPAETIDGNFVVGPSSATPRSAARPTRRSTPSGSWRRSPGRPRPARSSGSPDRPAARPLARSMPSESPISRNARLTTACRVDYLYGSDLGDRVRSTPRGEPSLRDRIDRVGGPPLDPLA